MSAEHRKLWDPHAESWVEVENSKTALQRFRALILKGLGALFVAALGFVGGAILPVPSVIVDNRLVRPLAEWARATPLVVNPELALACDDPSVSPGGVVSTAPNVDINSNVEEYEAKRSPLPSLSSHTAVFKQVTIHASIRHNWNQPVIIERIFAEASPLDAQALDWIALSEGSCGGGGPVGTRVYRLNLDKGTDVKPDFDNSRGLEKASGTRFTVLPDSPTDVEVDLRSCEKSYMVRILMDYTVQGVTYKDQVVAETIVVTGLPARKVEYGDDGQPATTTKWKYDRASDVCHLPFRRQDSE